MSKRVMTAKMRELMAELRGIWEKHDDFGTIECQPHELRTARALERHGLIRVVDIYSVCFEVEKGANYAAERAVEEVGG